MMRPMQVKNRPETPEPTQPNHSASYLNGIGSVLNIFGAVSPEPQVRSGSPEGIAGDWQRIGQDLAAAFEKGDPTTKG